MDIHGKSEDTERLKDYYPHAWLNFGNDDPLRPVQANTIYPVCGGGVRGLQRGGLESQRTSLLPLRLLLLAAVVEVWVAAS